MGLVVVAAGVATEEEEVGAEVGEGEGEIETTTGPVITETGMVTIDGDDPTLETGVGMATSGDGKGAVLPGSTEKIPDLGHAIGGTKWQSKGGAKWDRWVDWVGMECDGAFGTMTEVRMGGRAGQRWDLRIRERWCAMSRWPFAIF